MTKINPKEWYSLNAIAKEKMLPWAKDIKTVRKVVDHDLKNGKILQPVITNTGHGKRYLIKGENILKFIQAVQTGKVKLHNLSKYDKPDTKPRGNKA